jgi:VWFA-related protein
MRPPKPLPALALTTLIVVSLQCLHGQQTAPETGETFRFRSGVELINVTATVSDQNGRFVPGLRKEDFVVYDDEQPVDVTHFSADRVPVSLGIALDTSGSMAGDKIRQAQSALDRFVYDLLGPQDELFVYRFGNYPVLLQGWTRDRQQISRALARIVPVGGTAMYDAVAEAVPVAAQGFNAKKALLIISDGNDTASAVSPRQAKQMVRESEVLVYAVGIDGESEGPSYRQPPPQIQPPRTPIPFPIPFPPRGRGRFPNSLNGLPAQGWSRRTDDRVNVAALRELTDDSGGRTEIIREARDLDPATTAIADELSKQYYLGYAFAGKKDGRFHSIRVAVRNSSYRVRARRGYVAS